MRFSIIIPAYNEAECIRDVLEKLTQHLRKHSIDAEVILVNDGSKDSTGEIAEKVETVRVIHHPYNKGYGASLKTGVRHAKGEWCITYDADNQHTPELLDGVIAKCGDAIDMVVGARKGYKGPWIRQPGKRLLGMIANYLVEKKIPDLNSGLRAFRRSLFLYYEHLFPDGFSLSTTSTVCFFKEKHTVVYTPIAIQERIGKSTVRPRDMIKTLMLILRLIMLFSPLKIFLPASVVMGVATCALLAHGLIIERNISDSAIALLYLTTFLFFFGLLADQIAAVRREIHRKRT